jgi:hypothetical protein
VRRRIALVCIPVLWLQIGHFGRYDQDMENAEIHTTHSARTVPRVQTLKSKVTNGRRVFAIGGDGRSGWTRRWRDLVELHVSDCGGAVSVSEAMISLCRRVAAIEVQLEQMEARMSEGDLTVDLDLYNRLAGNLRRMLESIGLQRVSRDVTPSLSSYIDAKERS